MTLVRVIGADALAVLEQVSSNDVPRGVGARERQEAVIELKWFYSEAEGDLGMRAASLEPSGGDSDGAAKARRRTEACVRWTEAVRRLRLLPQGDERVLRVAYSPVAWPGLERHYELAGVCALLVERRQAPSSVIAAHMATRTESDESGALATAGRAVAGLETAPAAELKLKARAALRAALAAYVRAK